MSGKRGFAGLRAGALACAFAGALSLLAAAPAAAEAAYVFGSRNSIGLACGEPDAAAALAAATRACAKNSAACRTVVAFRKQCIAIARPVDERDANWHSLAVSPTVAQRRALALCQARHNAACRIVAGCCD
jgi:hypothetical protein